MSAASLWLIPRAADAKDERRVRIDYASEACPRRDVFDAELRSRVDVTLRAPAGSEPARTVVVRIDGSGKKLRGTLVVRELDGTTSTRAVDGESCEVVSSGLALVAALAIEEGGTRPAETAAAASPSPGEAAKGGATDATSPARPSAEKPAPTAPPPPATQRESAPQREPTPADGETRGARPAHAEVALGVGVGMFLGAAPRPSPVVSPFAEVAYVLGSGSTLAARARLSRGGASASGSPSASFTWTAADLDLCPLGETTQALRLSACGRVEAGSLDAQGSGVTPAIDEARAWVALGAALRLRWTFLAPGFAEAEATLVAPLLRDRFYVLPEQTVFRAPVLAGGGAVSVGIVF